MSKWSKEEWSKPFIWFKEHKKTSIFLIIFLIIFIVGCASILSIPVEKNVKMTSCYMAQQFVKKELKAPSTAKFQNCYDAKITEKTTPNLYGVGSYVDSQNSFGAMIRTEYYAELKYLGEDNWKLVSLVYL